jgi:hypothetical protein
MTGSRWRLTPGLWLLLKLAAIAPIVRFTGQIIMRIYPREQVILIAMLMGITLFDGLVTMWTYRRRVV